MNDVLRARCEESLHVITADGETLVGDRAVIHVYEGLGYGALVGWLRWAPMRWFTGPVYDWVARNRRFAARFAFRGDST